MPEPSGVKVIVTVVLSPAMTDAAGSLVTLNSESCVPVMLATMPVIVAVPTFFTVKVSGAPVLTGTVPKLRTPPLSRSVAGGCSTAMSASVGVAP